LDEACGDDVELRREVESLLKFNEQDDQFLEEPAIDIAVESLLQAALKPDQRIGNYKVVSHVGSGGMGEVYLAYDEKLNRRVALKLVRFGIGSEESARHFLREGQILASLNHPNIAQIHGAEITAEGISFLVMEYVEGLRIDKYCEDNQLSIRDRLEILCRVCGAVHYAHQRLVIHRDIKPANILITKESEPKLLDFGIAKLLDPETSTAGEQTVTFAGAMTPDYASPEQVRGETMTTASDVYSLGVILYELLSGQRPYRIKARNAAELARAITEQEPARPSTAVTRGSSLKLANQRNLKSRATLLRGDLDNIVLKAMRKEPQRRYTSVEQFSEDIHRHLANLPVIARPDTRSYRTAKFIQRHKAGVAAATLVLVSLTSGIVATLWQAHIAREQRDLAQHEKLKAERINAFLQRMLSFSNQSITSVWPVAERRDVTVNDMLDQITPKVQAELSSEPDVRAQVERTIGSAYASQGRYDLAERNLRGALKEQVRLYGEQSPEAADTMSELGVLCYREGKIHEAGSLLEKAVAIYRKQRQTNDPAYSAAKLALALDYFGTVKFYEIDPYVGKQLVLEALQVSSGANLKPDERWVLAVNKSEAGGAMVYTGEVDKGEPLLREALAEFHQISNRPQWEQASTLTSLGVAAMNRRQFDDAQKLLKEGEQLFRATLGDKNFYLAANLNRQAAVLSEENDLITAEAKAREAVAMVRNCSAEHGVLWGGGSLVTLGKILIKSGRASEGEDYLRQALSIYDRQSTKNYFSIGKVKMDLSQCLLTQNRLTEAEQIAIEAREDVLRNLGAQHPAMQAANKNLIAVYEKEGKHKLAEGLK
jgi:eukaryotic-like serine/threonine-protein kinase